jgi:dienelactone hydrolase
LTRISLAAAAILAAASPGAAAPGSSFPVEAPRGATVAVLTDVPRGDPPFPALVLAPGGGYPAAAPFHAELAAAASGAGYLVFRMDWAYWTAGGSASADLADEREDLRAVLAAVRKDPRVDPDRVTLAGKSLGSLVAYEVFAEDESLRALALLTPLCVRHWDDGESVVNESYPGLAAHERPVVVLYGTEDPACNADALAAALGEGAARVTVLVVPGDHKLLTGDAEADAENRVAAALAVVEALGAP